MAYIRSKVDIFTILCFESMNITKAVMVMQTVLVVSL